MKKLFLCIAFCCMLTGCEKKAAMDIFKMQLFTEDTSPEMWSKMWGLQDVFGAMASQTDWEINQVELDLRNPNTDYLYTVFTGYTDLTIMPTNLYFLQENAEADVIGGCNKNHAIVIGDTKQGRVGVVGIEKTMDNYYYPVSLSIDVDNAIRFENTESAIQAYRNHDIDILCISANAFKQQEDFPIIGESDSYPEYIIALTTSREDVADKRINVIQALQNTFEDEQGKEKLSYVGLQECFEMTETEFSFVKSLFQ